MIQKTSFELVLTPQEAEQYQRTIHRAICLLDKMPPETAGAFERTQLRADLMRLAMRFDDAVLPPVPPPVRGVPFDPFTAEVPLPLADPFTPEGDGSARDVLLGRLVSVSALLLGYLTKTAWPGEERAVLQKTKAALLADWREYEELGRG